MAEYGGVRRLWTLGQLQRSKNSAIPSPFGQLARVRILTHHARPSRNGEGTRCEAMLSAARPSDRTAFETKPYLEGYLELWFALRIHRSPDVLDLEPIEVAERLAGLFERILRTA